MCVSIGEARHHESAIRPYHLGFCADIASDLGRVADCENLAGADGDRARLAAAGRETGPHVSASDHEIGLGSTGRNEQREGNQS